MGEENFLGIRRLDLSLTDTPNYWSEILVKHKEQIPVGDKNCKVSENMQTNTSSIPIYYQFTYQ